MRDVYNINLVPFVRAPRYKPINLKINTFRFRTFEQDKQGSALEMYKLTSEQGRT